MNDADRAGHPLEWKQHGFMGRVHELSDGPDAIARMTLGGFLRHHAECEADGETWKLRSANGWMPNVVVESRGGETLAIYHAGWFGHGTLEMPGSATRWTWKPRFWPGWEYAFHDAGVPVVRMKPRIAFRGARVRVRVERERIPARELRILLSLGYFLVLRARRGRAR